ncbi:MAG TPA: HAD hydrolase family protein [Planctomycetota bacterium]|nr:HAD hydrolase family protein [Planctomycetota bacterium]
MSLGETAEGVRPGKRGFPAVDAYRRLKLIVFDVDGVLTDGRIIHDANGVESKFFDVRDGAGMTFIRFADLMIGIITGRSSPVVDVRARELKVPPERVKQGAIEKLPVFEQMMKDANVSASETAYVGDDLIDLPVLEVAGLACCVGDAHADVMAVSHVISSKPGGRGGVRQICEHILKRRDDGSWEKAMGRYLKR